MDASQVAPHMDPLQVAPLQVACGIIALTILCVVGACGGYLSAIRKNTATLGAPRWSSKAVQCRMMQGVAGAIIIVTLCPVDESLVSKLFSSGQALIKLIALALIGGYAGVTLLEAFAAQYAKRIIDIEDRQKANEEGKKKDLEAIRTAEQILRGLVFTSAQKQAFREAVKEISSSARFEIARRSDEVRRENWDHNKEELERSLFVFQCLVQTDDAKSNHWWYASLGYCLKDKNAPDYQEAAKFLDTAIRLRGPESRSGAQEFNRAFCNIKLWEEQTQGDVRQELEKQINDDLDTAGMFPRYKKIIDTNPTVQDWLRKQKPGPLALRPAKRREVAERSKKPSRRSIAVASRSHLDDQTNSNAA